MIRVAAVADIHSPKYLALFRRALVKLRKCDLFLFVGDSVLKNDYTQFPAVLNSTREFYDGPIFACFGNEEYEQDFEKYGNHPGVEWIDDRAIKVEIKGTKVGIVGSRGSLDRPTFWQRRHMEGIVETYRKRVQRVDELLAELRADVKIVMTHYAPTYTTLEGERELAKPEMACRAFENVIGRRQPDVWFHGHGHKSKKLQTTIGRTLVSNVSLPCANEITVIELPRKAGLERFFS